MNILEQYEQELKNLLASREKLAREFECNSVIYKSLKTDSDIPDVHLLDFLAESIPDWTSVLDRDTVVAVIKYASSPSPEEKEKLINRLIRRDQKIVYQRRKLNFELNEAPIEIDKEVSECDIKIRELHEQLKTIANRIGTIEAEKEKWLSLKKEI